MRKRAFLGENGLTLFFLGIFLAAVVFQGLVGWHDFNNDQLRHHGNPVTLGRYLFSSEFGVALLENWQSEYLQFTLYILGTVWLLQRGSPESKPLDQAGRESEERQKIGPHAGSRSPGWARAGGLRAALYSNSLLVVMGTIWLASWLGQSVTGRSAYNSMRFEHHQDAVSYTKYLGSADFWERTGQNWQSEFLAVASMAILAVYLRLPSRSRSARRTTPPARPAEGGAGGSEPRTRRWLTRRTDRRYKRAFDS